MAEDKTLLVAYLFPPSGGVGVQRAVAYAKYLPKVGCPVTVLTASNAVTALKDPSLLKTLPPETRIYRTFTPELSYELREKIWSRIAPEAKPGVAPVAKSSGGVKGLIKSSVQRFLLPDPQVYWGLTAIRKGAELIEREGIQNVLVTAPPFSAFRIGIALKKRFPHIRLISEFRDEWLGYYIKIDPNATDLKIRTAEALERETVELSDYIVTVTPSWVEAIHSRYPQYPASKFVCVPNGFDPQSFARFADRPHGLDRMVVTYVGTIYSNPVYSPALYLEALNRLPEEIRSRIETRFIGRVVDEEIPRIDGSASPTKRLGFMPQAEAFRHLEETDCVLLIANNPTWHSGKFFEYLASGKPIIALSPRGGELARMIAETGSGWCADPSDPADVQQMLTNAFAAIRQGRTDLLPRPNPDKIRRYERPQLVAGLAEAARMGTFA